MEATADVRSGGLTLDADSADAQGVYERRLESKIEVSPIPEVRVGVGVPVLFRTLELSDEVRSANVLGDVELVGRFRLFEARGGAAHHVWLTSFVKFPTAPIQLDLEGDALPSNLQPGCSSVVPSVGAQYVFGQPLWQVVLGGAIALPFAVREAPHRGALTNLVANVVVTPWEALQLSAGMKWLLEATGDDGTGEGEVSSGGLTGYAAVAIDVDVLDHLRAGASLDVPVVEALRGDQSPTPIFGLRVSGRWDVTSPTNAVPATVLASNDAGRF